MRKVELSTPAGIAKFLGISQAQFAKLSSTPAGKRNLENLTAAAKANNGLAVSKYLGVFMQQTPGAWKRTINKLPLGRAGYMRDMILSRATDTTLSAAEGWQVAKPGAGTSAMQSQKIAPYVPPKLHSMIAAEAKRIGVPTSALTALVQTESSGNAHAISGQGAIGLGQILPGGALAWWNKHNPHEQFTPRDMLDPTKNLKVSGAYYAMQVKRNGGSLDLGYLGYHGGPGPKGYAAMQTFDSYLLQDHGQAKAIANARTTATGGASELQGSRYITGASDTVIATFKGITSAGDAVAKVFEQIAKNGNAMLAQKYSGGQMVGNAWVPSSAVPNAQKHITK